MLLTSVDRHQRLFLTASLHVFVDAFADVRTRVRDAHLRCNAGKYDFGYHALFDREQ